ncbi:alpha/beta-hydrolase [Daldinia eschscholtzii]|nr:alpha/beta-hydrolase [Daldinia eschscholtzii]
MMTLSRETQPLKALYIIYFTLKLPFVLLSLIIYYTIPSLRPIREWTIRTSVATYIIRIFFNLVSVIGLSSLRPLTAEKAKERFAYIEPGEDELYSGVLSPAAIKPVPLKGLWDADQGGPVTIDKSKVLLLFPGGAFVFAFDPYEGSSIVSDLVRRVPGARVFLAQYRLATSAAGRFPAAIQDALTFYNYILNLGIDPKDIIFLGDSAGGNVAVGLLRYLEESQKLPLPGGVLAYSPWIHVTNDAKSQYGDSPKLRTDCINYPVLQTGYDKYIPEGGMTPEVAPYFSPMTHPFKTSVPVYIQSGEAEVFYDENKQFAEAMEGIEGNKVKFHTIKNAPHDLILSHRMVGLTAEATASVEDAIAFVSKDVD